MHENVHHHVVYFFLLFFSFRSVRSEIQTIKLSSDARPFILFEDFGFSNPGYISVTISSVSIATTKSIFVPTKLSLMGVFYAPTPARQAIKLAFLKDICIIGKPFIFPIFTFDEKTILSQSHFNKTVLVTIPDLYYIFFVNCAKNSSVTLTVDLETYNIKPNGDRDYIDEHFASMPTTLFFFSLFFFVFLVTWSYACNTNKHYVHKIHIVMAILLFLKFLELNCYANSQNSIRRSGLPHGWNILWLAINFAINVLFIVVIMLIGAGWSLFRPTLKEPQICAMSLTIFLQILASTCFILIHGVGPSDKHYRYWILMYYAMDFLCCVTMMLPARKSIDELGLNSRMEGKEAKRLTHKKVYENFVLALYLYVGFTRLAVFALRTTTSFKFWCSSIALELSIEVIFYIVVYLMFWPNERYDYVVVEDKEDESGSMASPRSGSRVLN
ncbi:protein CANDIDATE G-PROTEIN COUPLED RECEPTOR 7 [Sesamum angolense]|uniref:Protein CANDIDATE G-PROTEIN COUPLED RECEPTOR 7 n=1 Tax=Sesamum angolense TaxID=2727404 RepID=A0AAE2BVY6_9LAMI|nr:protein CANDIDATE G-PROTEIN COUPLED RECEPTOR 7 [Sesamum angolense]